MPRVPSRGGVGTTSANVRTSYTVGASDWYRFARAVQYLRTAGIACLPATKPRQRDHLGTNIHRSIPLGTTATFPVAFRESPTGIARLWAITGQWRQTPVRQKMVFTDPSGETHNLDFTVTMFSTVGPQPREAGVSRVAYAIEEPPNVSDDLKITTDTIALTTPADGQFEVLNIGCFEVPRSHLAAYLDDGIPDAETLQGNQPIGGNVAHDATVASSAPTRSFGGILSALDRAIRFAERGCLFGWMADETSATAATSGYRVFTGGATSLFVAPVPAMPRRTDATGIGRVRVYLRARVSAGGTTGRFTASSAEAADTITQNVTSTSWGWYDVGLLDLQDEDPGATADRGAQSNAPIGETVSFTGERTAGAGEFQVSGVYLFPEPIEMGGRAFSPTDVPSLRAWWDADHGVAINYATGAVTGWKEATNAARTAAERIGDAEPPFGGNPTGHTAAPSATIRSRGAIDHGSNEGVLVAAGPGDAFAFDATRELTLYVVGKGSGSGSEQLLSCDDGSGGWTLFADRASAGASFQFRNGTGSLVTVTEGTASGGWHLYRVRMVDEGAGNVRAYLSVDGGAEVSALSTGYTHNDDELVFGGIISGGGYAWGNVDWLACVLVIHQDVAADAVLEREIAGWFRRAYGLG